MKKYFNTLIVMVFTTLLFAGSVNAQTTFSSYAKSTNADLRVVSLTTNATTTSATSDWLLASTYYADTLAGSFAAINVSSDDSTGVVTLVDYSFDQDSIASSDTLVNVTNSTSFDYVYGNFADPTYKAPYLRFRSVNVFSAVDTATITTIKSNLLK